jgi:hypothetical protein
MLPPAARQSVIGEILFRVTSVVGLPPFAPRLDRLIQNQLLQSRGHQLTVATRLGRKLRPRLILGFQLRAPSGLTKDDWLSAPFNKQLSL